MSVHKLTAGSGYDYLTRQVAALDATEKGHTGLASYYTERGESPGLWIVRDGRDRRLGCRRPGDRGADASLVWLRFAPTGRAAAAATGGTRPDHQDFQNVARLGRRSRSSTTICARFGSRWPNASRRSIPPSDGWPTPRSRRLTGLGCGLRWHGSSSPLSMAESQVTPESWRDKSRKTRGREHRAAGCDLTFSPVKSVSTLWAVADPAVAAVIERAHQAAVQDALAFIEKHALFTRTGRQGIRQVNVRGLVAAAFTHRDSRAGTRICTPTRRRTWCRPSTDAGCRSTDGCCSKPMWLRRRATTPRSSSTFARPWGAVC